MREISLLAIEFRSTWIPSPGRLLPNSPAQVSTGPKIKLRLLYIDNRLSKGGSMRKSVIRLLVAVALLISGSLVPVYAANTPMPMPPLPPVHSN